MSTAYWFDSAPFTASGEFHPVPLTTTTESGHTVKQLNPSQSIRFASNSASVGIYSYYSTAAGRTYVLLQDGAEVGSVDIPASGAGAWDVFNLATGLDTGSVHEYELLCITPIQGGIGNWFDGYLELDDDSLAEVVHTQRFVWGMYGDSITAVSNSVMTTLGSDPITDTRYGDSWLACQSKGYGMAIVGVAGGKVVNTGRDSTGNIATDIDGLCVRYGYNDGVDFPSGAATFRAAYSDMIDNARARIGANKPILCLRPYDNVGDAHQVAIGVEIQAAIAGKANVFYSDTAGWITADNAHLPDNTHPNVVGYDQTAPPLAAALASVFIEDRLVLVQTANSSPVTELVRRAAVVDGVAGTLADEVIHHSGDYPRQPDNGYAYQPSGSELEHVYVYSGTLTLSQAQAERDGTSSDILGLGTFMFSLA